MWINIGVSLKLINLTTWCINCRFSLNEMNNSHDTKTYGQIDQIFYIKNVTPQIVYTENNPKLIHYLKSKIVNINHDASASS